MTKIQIPVELTYSRLSAAAASRINTLHALIGKPTVAEGVVNPYKELLDDLSYGSNGFDRTSPIATSNSLKHPEQLTRDDNGEQSFDKVALIVSLGGDVIDLPVFFEITDKTADCPFSTTTPKESWENWDGGYLMGPYANKWYRESAVASNKGTLMAASQWLQLTRHTTLTLSEIQTIQSENSSLVP